MHDEAYCAIDIIKDCNGDLERDKLRVQMLDAGAEEASFDHIGSAFLETDYHLIRP